MSPLLCLAPAVTKACRGRMISGRLVVWHQTKKKLLVCSLRRMPPRQARYHFLDFDFGLAARRMLPDTFSP